MLMETAIDVGNMHALVDAMRTERDAWQAERASTDQRWRAEWSFVWGKRTETGAGINGQIVRSAVLRHRRDGEDFE